MLYYVAKNLYISFFLNHKSIYIHDITCINNCFQDIEELKKSERLNNQEVTLVTLNYNSMQNQDTILKLSCLCKNKFNSKNKIILITRQRAYNWYDIPIIMEAFVAR